MYSDPLVGRDLEVSTIQRCLNRDDIRLVTLTGLGGVGKTRVAVEVASRVAGSLPDTVEFVDLASIDDPVLFLPAVAHALEVKDPGDSPLVDRIATTLGDRRFLLVLDNVERIVPVAAEIVLLLGRCPGLQVLSTSRIPFRLREEFEVPIRPLPVPDPATLELDELMGNEAVALFLQRANAADPNLKLTKENGAAIAQICRRLNGVPLALELAAQRVRVLPPVLLAQVVERTLPLLVGGPHDAPARHRTMRDALSWSIDNLSRHAMNVFPKLTVFVGSWTLPAASEVLSIARNPDDTVFEPNLTVLDAVLELSEFGLLRSAWRSDNETGFTMLEVVREFGLEILDASARSPNLRDAHAEYYLRFAEESSVGLTGPDQSTWMAHLHSEYENLRTALTWVIRSEDKERALRLSGALWQFWARTGHLGEGRMWLERALSLGPAEATPELARAVQSLGNLALDIADYQQADDRFQESLALYRELDNQTGVGSALTGLGLTAGFQGSYEKARTLHETCLTQWRTTGDRRREAISLHNLGDLMNAAGNSNAASDLHRQALAIQHSIGDAGGVAYSTLSLAEAACDGGELSAAGPLFEHGLKRFEQLGDDIGIAYVHFGFGRLAHRNGDLVGAARGYASALEMRSKFGDRIGMVECVEGLAAVAAGVGKFKEARSLLAATTATRVGLGAAYSAGARKTMEEARALLGDSQSTSLLGRDWGVEQVWTLDEICTVAASVADIVDQDSTGNGLKSPIDLVDLSSLAQYGLSLREREILQLLGLRLTDKEIADQLYISHHTVHRHVTNILGKLGVANRREAAAIASREVRS